MAKLKECWSAIKKKSRIKKIIIAGVAFIASIVTIISGIVTIFSFFDNKNTDIDPITNVTNNNFFPNSVIYIYNEETPDLSLANEYYSQGQEFFHINDYDKALEKYDEALGEYKNKPVNVDKARIQYAIGLLYKKRGNLNEAIEWYSSAIGTLNSFTESDEIKNELSYVYYLRGNAYLDNRDLERAMLDCENCNSSFMSSNVSPKITYSSILCMKGRILMASYYGTHSIYPVNGGVDLGATWFDVMDCFEEALFWNGMRPQLANCEEISSYDGTAVKSFLSDVPLILNWFSSYKGEDINEDFYWIIENADAETAAILNYRATLLIMAREESKFYHELFALYLSEARANSEAALKIYNDLSADERNGLQNTYFDLAQITMMEFVENSDNEAVDPITIKTYCEYIEQMVKYTQRWCGKSKNTAIALENMGFAYLFAHDYNSAKENFLEALSIFEYLGLDEDAAKQEKYIEDVEYLEKCDLDDELELVIG